MKKMKMTTRLFWAVVLLCFTFAMAAIASKSFAQGGRYPVYGGDTTHLTIGTGNCFLLNGNAYPMNSAVMVIGRDTTTIGFYLVNTYSNNGAHQLCQVKGYGAYYNDSTSSFFTSANAVWNFYKFHMVK